MIKTVKIFCKKTDFWDFWSFRRCLYWIRSKPIVSTFFIKILKSQKKSKKKQNFDELLSLKHYRFYPSRMLEWFSEQFVSKHKFDLRSHVFPLTCCSFILGRYTDIQYGWTIIQIYEKNDTINVVRELDRH
jgi:hypothetical protein